MAHNSPKTIWCLLIIFFIGAVETELQKKMSMISSQESISISHLLANASVVLVENLM